MITPDSSVVLIAAAIVFVAIGKATFMTGQSISVDGGVTAG